MVAFDLMVGFEINLKEFILGDVLQFLARVKKSGVLKVFGGVSGEIYLQDGLVIHATDGSEKGMEALFNLSFVDLDKANFELGISSPEQTISEELGKLTENIEKRRIEFEEIKKKLPPLETILTKSTKDLEFAVALRRTDWQILALIDGKRKLGDVIDESKIGGYEVTKTVVWLKDQGLIYDAAATERVMSKLTEFLGVLFENFAKNGLNWLKKWSEVNANNKKTLDALQINEETLEIEIKTGLTSAEIDEVLKNLEEFINVEGPKVYGKLLFRKKFEDFKKKIKL